MKELIEKYKKQIKEAIEQLKTPGERKKQIPNILTATRLLAPFIIIPSVATGNFVTAGISTLLFSATDMVDGYIARKLKITSDLGKDLDAFSDKLFVGTLMISLLLTNPIYSIPLVLEGTIAGININKKLKNKNPESHMVGKVKMTVLYFLLACGFVNMYISIPEALINSLFLGTIGLQALTIGDYAKGIKEKTSLKEKNDIEVTKELENEEEKENVISKEKNITQEYLEKYKFYRILLQEQQKLENEKNLEEQHKKDERTKNFQLKIQNSNKK